MIAGIACAAAVGGVAAATWSLISDRGGRRRSRVGVVFALALASMLSRVVVPIAPIWYSPHDDLALITQARSLLDGDWLGPWTQYTLLKGPGYAFVLVGANIASVPPTLFVQAAYVFAALFLVAQLGFLTGRRWLAIMLFAAVVMNPAYLGDSASRVYRDGALGPAVLALIGLGILCARTAATQRILPFRRYTAAAAAFGALTAFLVLTKSDAVVWAAFPVAGMALVVTLFHPRRQRAVRIGVRLSLGLVIAMIITAGAWGSVAAVNSWRYGYSGVEDLKSGGEQALWRALTSIDGGSGQEYVAVSKRQRLQAYAVSPAAAALAPVLDGQTGWKLLSCNLTRVCGEASTWQEMELRDAVVAAGGSTSEDFQRLMHQAADEILLACAAGSLRCEGGSPIVGIGNLREIRYRATLGSWLRLFSGQLRYVSASAAPRPPEHIPRNLDNVVATIWRTTVVGADGQTGWRAPSPAARVEAIDGLASVYRWLTWVGVAVGAPLALALLVVRRSSRRSWLTLGAACAFALGAAANALIVAIFDANMGYLGTGASLYLLPSSPALVLAVGLVYVCLWRRMRSLVCERRVL